MIGIRIFNFKIELATRLRASETVRRNSFYEPYHELATRLRASETSGAAISKKEHRSPCNTTTCFWNKKVIGMTEFIMNSLQHDYVLLKLSHYIRSTNFPQFLQHDYVLLKQDFKNNGNPWSVGLATRLRASETVGEEYRYVPLAPACNTTTCFWNASLSCCNNCI